MNASVKSKRTQKRYSPELKDRAVRLVMQLRAETGEKHGSVKRIAEQLDRCARGSVKPRSMLVIGLARRARTPRS